MRKSGTLCRFRQAWAGERIGTQSQRVQVTGERWDTYFRMFTKRTVPNDSIEWRFVFSKVLPRPTVPTPRMAARDLIWPAR
jgi:hypothetical protein